MLAGVRDMRASFPVPAICVTACHERLLTAKPPGADLPSREAVPRRRGSGGVLAGALCGTAATLYALAPSAEAWSQRAPEVLRTLEIRARAISGGIARSVGAELAPPTAPGATPDAVGKLVEGGDRLITDLAISAPSFVGGAIYWAALSFFMLRDRAALARRVLALGPDAAAQRALGRAMRDEQSDVSRYLLAITVINITLGACVAAAFAALGVPNAGFWGLATGLLNYMPFVCPVLMTVVTLGVGVVGFEDPVVAFAPIVVIVARMRLSAVGVFVAIAFGAWLWGAAGALIATPTLIVVGAFFKRLYGLPSGPPRQRERGDQRRDRRERPARAGDRAQG
jgi:predicted PurR-regulated permease PerM